MNLKFNSKKPAARPRIMAILNITADSFSDGGLYLNPKKAIQKAKKLISEGADILDIGGESSGPNSQKISNEEEISRVIPIIKAIREFSKIPISIDTFKAKVAIAALKAGANMVNDVTALRGDPQMAGVIATKKCQVILMYSKDRTSSTTIKAKRYSDIIKSVEKFFNKQIAYAKKQGIKMNRIILDPGMGHFISAKPSYSYEIIARLRELKAKFPKNKFLIGISRKSFLGGEMKLENSAKVSPTVLSENSDPHVQANTLRSKFSCRLASGTFAEFSLRDERAKTISAIAYLNGASIIRTHDPKGLTNFFSWLKWN